MNCKAFRVEIEESDDAKPRSHEASVHLESCANCAAFGNEQLALKGMIESLEVVTAPADFDFRLRARLAALKGEHRGHVSWNRYIPNTRALAIAAVLVIVIIVGLVVRQAKLVRDADNERDRIVKSNPVDEPAPSTPLAATSPSDKRPESAASSAVDFPNTVMTQARRTGNTRIEKNTKDIHDESIVSKDLGSTSTASTVLPPGIPDPMTLSSTMVAIPVRASMRPTTIMLKGGGTQPQSISLRPVTFGGQDLFDLENPGKGFLPTVQGIW